MDIGLFEHSHDHLAVAIDALKQVALGRRRVSSDRERECVQLLCDDAIALLRLVAKESGKGVHEMLDSRSTLEGSVKSVLNGVRLRSDDDMGLCGTLLLD